MNTATLIMQVMILKINKWIRTFVVIKTIIIEIINILIKTMVIIIINDNNL